MFADTTSNQVYRISVQAAVLTTRGLAGVLALLAQKLAKLIDQSTPQKSLGRIVRGAQGVLDTPLHQEEVKNFAKFARKYGVEFAAMPDPEKKGIVNLVFKSSKARNIELALNDFLKQLPEKKKESVMTKLASAVSRAAAAAGPAVKESELAR